MIQLITIGETMVAFAPQGEGLLRYAAQYIPHTAGAESNVAIGVQKLGCNTAWISRVGQDEFGQYLCNAVRSEGVDCAGVLKDKTHPTGLMFKQQLAGKTSVFYYRKGSAASFLSPSDLNEAQFAQAEILHMTGITPVLSEECLATTRHAFALAHQYGKKISFDPNIRKKLWKNTDYTLRIRELTLAADVVLVGREEAQILFGMSEPERICDYLLNKKPEAVIAVKDGENGAVVANAAEMLHITPTACRCIEPTGAGDAFNAGFLAGILKKKTLEECGRMGGIAGALATETTGDTEGQPDETRMAEMLGNIRTVDR